MGFSTVFSRDYTLHADTAFGAAGTVTGEGGYGRDVTGNKFRVISGLLEIAAPQANAGDPFILASDPADNQTLQGSTIRFKLADFSGSPADWKIEVILAFRTDLLTGSYRVGIWNFGSWSIFAKADKFYDPSGGGGSFAIDPSHIIELHARRTAINLTTITATVTDKGVDGTGNTVLATATFTDNGNTGGTGYGPQDAGQAGVGVSIRDGLTPGDGTARIRYWAVETDTGLVPLVGGSLSIGTRTPTTVPLTIGPDSGGEPPSTYQGYISPTPNFTPGGGNIVSGFTGDGAVGGDYTDATITGDQVKYLKAKWVDSATPTAQTATSEELAYTLPTSPPVVPSPNADKAVDVFAAFLGDSRIYCENGGTLASTRGVSDWWAFYIKQYLTPGRTVTALNRGRNATQTTDWLPTAAPQAGDSSNLITLAHDAIAAQGGVTVLYLYLGTNDSSFPTYRAAVTTVANLATIIAHIFTWVFSDRQILQVRIPDLYYAIPGVYPPGGPPAFTDQSIALMVAVNALLPSLDNGTTVIFEDGAILLRRSVDNPTGFLADGLHGSTGDGGGRDIFAKTLVGPYATDVLGVADTTPPLVTSAILGTDGVTLTLTLSEAVTGTSGLSVRVNGIARTATWAAPDSTHIVGTLASAAQALQTVTWSYDPAAGNVLDTSSNEMAAVTNATVTNNSTQGSSGGGGGGGGGTVQYLLMASGWPTPDTVTLTAGDTAGALAATLRDAAGNPVPVSSGASVVFALREVGSSGAAVTGAASIEYGAGGIVAFGFSTDSPVPAAGRYEATFRVDGLTLPPTRIPVTVRAAL